jgi:Ca-activated chloride channel family protein
MRQEGRLELVKESLRLLVRELDEGDAIGVVAFSTQAWNVLESTSAAERERILDAVATLQPTNNTNVGAGLELGFAMAARHRLEGGSNRVILLSDGVANTGVVDPEGMLARVRSEREKGIFMTVVGVGMGNHNDALLEQLADRGNGQCFYVDRIDEARKVFVERLTGTLETIAKDVKVQVEFDPERVLRWRLLGYENRDVADAAFRDNTVDAGEVGAGHEVTALYELKLRPEGSDGTEAKGTEAEGAAAKGKGTEAKVDGRVATVRVRYLTVDHGEAIEHEKPILRSEIRARVEDAAATFILSVCAAELAEVLRGSYWARGGSLEHVSALLEAALERPLGEGGPRLGEDPDVVELAALVQKADALVRQRDAQADELARAVDAVKENHYLRARIEEELRLGAETRRGELEEIERQNRELRRRLESLLER